MIEWLGNEQYAYIPYDAPESMVAGLEELERELDSERMRSQLVVALDPMSRIDDDSDATLWLDPRRMHIFDPAERRQPHQSGDGRPSPWAPTPAPDPTVVHSRRRFSSGRSGSTVVR